MAYAFLSGGTLENLLILRRNILPGGHVSCFQWHTDEVFPREEQRHFRNRFSHGEMIDERIDEISTAGVGYGGQGSLAAQFVFLCPNLAQQSSVNAVGIAGTGRV